MLTLLCLALLIKLNLELDSGVHIGSQDMHIASAICKWIAMHIHWSLGILSVQAVAASVPIYHIFCHHSLHQTAQNKANLKQAGAAYRTHG